jgi:hypothetical protein
VYPPNFGTVDGAQGVDPAFCNLFSLEDT